MGVPSRQRALRRVQRGPRHACPPLPRSGQPGTHRQDQPPVPTVITARHVLEGTMLTKTCVLTAVVAGLLWTSLPGVDAAGQAPGTRAARLRTETDNLALQDVAPFKVFDNLYYVGVGYVGSWLITTNQGLILIDTLEGAYKEHPIEGIRKLGFDPRNIKYVILTHYHLDHTAGAARIQELPGVRLVMGDADWDALTRAPNPNNERLPRRDIAVKDGDTITVGSTTVTLHVLGGHTPATLGVDFTVYDAGKPYRAFMFGGAAPGPGRSEERRVGKECRS